MTKFKVGDKVKVVGNTSGYEIPLQSLAEVLSVHTDALRGVKYYSINQEGENLIWYAGDNELELVEPTKETYEVGKWYGWNGGECPVDGETLVEGILQDGFKCNPNPARSYLWSYKGSDSAIVAFRIVSQEKPRVFVGWVDGIFHQDDTFFTGATHKLYEDMTLEKVDD